MCRYMRLELLFGEFRMSGLLSWPVGNVWFRLNSIGYGSAILDSELVKIERAITHLNHRQR